MLIQVKRHDGGWTPRPPQPPMNRMGSFGRSPYFRSWPGQAGQRQRPMMSDYVYTEPLQNSGRRRPGGRGRPVAQPNDFYSSSYDDAGQNAYADYIQPAYDYDHVGGVWWPSSPDDSDEASDVSDRQGLPKLSSLTTTISATSGDCLSSTYIKYKLVYSL